MAGRPRSIRSSLTMMKACSATGRLDTRDSDTSIGPTPSSALAVSIEARKSGLLGAMLAGGLLGGRMPAAPAGEDSQPPATAASTTTVPISPPRRSARERTRHVGPAWPTYPPGETQEGRITKMGQSVDAISATRLTQRVP